MTCGVRYQVKVESTTPYSVVCTDYSDTPVKQSCTLAFYSTVVSIFPEVFHIFILGYHRLAKCSQLTSYIPIWSPTQLLGWSWVMTALLALYVLPWYFLAKSQLCSSFSICSGYFLCFVASSHSVVANPGFLMPSSITCEYSEIMCQFM